jgi:hypothetical protein
VVGTVRVPYGVSPYSYPVLKTIRLPSLSQSIPSCVMRCPTDTFFVGDRDAQVVEIIVVDDMFYRVIL